MSSHYRHLVWRSASSGPPKPVNMRDQRQYLLEEHNSQEPSSAATSWGKLTLAIMIISVSAYSVQFLDWNLIKEWYIWARFHPGQTLPMFIILNALAVILLCPGALVQMFAGAGGLFNFVSWLWKLSLLN
jgi:hypothetical protein